MNESPVPDSLLTVPLSNFYSGFVGAGVVFLSRYFSLNLYLWVNESLLFELSFTTIPPLSRI